MRTEGVGHQTLEDPILVHPALALQIVDVSQIEKRMQLVDQSIEDVLRLYPDHLLRTAEAASDNLEDAVIVERDPSHLQIFPAHVLLEDLEGGAAPLSHHAVLNQSQSTVVIIVVDGDLRLLPSLVGGR